VHDLLIDVTRLVGRLVKKRLPTGIDRVCLAYVRQYASVARAVLQKGRFGMILPKSLSQQLFSALLDPDEHFTRRIVGIIAKSALLPSEEPSFSDSLVINIGHSGPEQPRYTEWLHRKRLRSIFMVHDLIPLTHPEYCRPSERARHTKRVETVLRTASAVVTNSNATLQVLSTYAAGRGCPMPPALALPLAFAALPGGGGHRPLPEPYFVMLSTIEPRKNHWMILHVWRRLIERLGRSAPRLVVIGQRGWECENVVDLLERCSALRGVVFHKTDCSDAELVPYLRHAQALVFPSFVEGYGLPLIEALSLGVPAIVSDLPVFREIAGDIPEYLDPLDGAGWMSCIEAFCDSNDPIRTAQLRRMTQFTAPSWSVHFEQFEKLLEQVA
jgi:glycosyltransferase involved in cell wall biosynthesis